MWVQWIDVERHNAVVGSHARLGPIALKTWQTDIGWAWSVDCPTLSMISGQTGGQHMAQDAALMVAIGILQKLLWTAQKLV